jgi:hypothetical protein
MAFQQRSILSYKSLETLAIAGTVALLVRLMSYHWTVMVNPFPNEYREAAMLTTTQALLTGINPYALENQPQYTNVYGILYPLVNVPLAFLGGVNLPFHRMVSGFFILASCFLIYRVMQRLEVGFFYRLSGTAVFYGHCIFACSQAYPNALGLFCFLLTLVIPWWFGYRRSSLIASIGFGILGFLAKPYFVLGIPYLFLYLLLRDWPRAVRYGCGAVVAFTTVMLGICWRFPLYLHNTIFIHNNVAGNNWDYLIRQLQVYFDSNSALVWLGVLTGLMYVVKHPTFDIPWKSLLKIDLFQVVLGLSMLAFVTKLGLHGGAWLSYLHHLISPFAIVVLFSIFKQQKLRLVNVVLVLLAVYQLRSPAILPDIPRDLSRNWQRLESRIAKADRVLAVPAAGSIIFNQHKTLWDNGESEYFQDGKNSVLAQSTNSEQQDRRYRQVIKEKMVRQEFDLVIAQAGIQNETFIDEKILNEKYQKVEELKVTHPFGKNSWRSWKLELYEPRRTAF